MENKLEVVCHLQLQSRKVT